MKSEKNNIIIRADASKNIGTGHFMRAIALCYGLKFIGIYPILITKDYNEEFIGLFKNKYKIKTIPNNINFIEDSVLTLDIAKKYKSKIIITDISNNTYLSNIEAHSNYLKSLKNFIDFLITIDGMGDDCFCQKLMVPSDIVIIPYFGAEKKIYKLSKNTELLAGASYFIFRPEFLNVQKLKNKYKKIATNILVSMGGSDPFNYTSKILNALIYFNRRPSIKARIVVGTGFSFSENENLKHLIKEYENNFELIYNPDNMAKLMIWADIAIINSGLTKYETCVTGLPAIVLSQYKYHEELMEDFVKSTGSVIHLGYGINVDESLISKTVKDLSDNFQKRKTMSINGKKLVDGKGVERIISKIIEKTNIDSLVKS